MFKDLMARLSPALQSAPGRVFTELLFASIRVHSRLFIVPLFTCRETRRPIQLLAFGMGPYQSVGTQLEKVAAIFESEFPNDPFEPFQVLKTNTGGPFWFLL